MASPLPDQLDFSSDEFLVSQILLEIPLLIQRPQFSLGLEPLWKRQRKRSALQSPPESSTSAAVLSPPSKKLKLSSPSSPIGLNSSPLSRTESDDPNPKPKRSRSNTKPSLDKKSQYLEAIDDLTKQNQGLTGEFEALKQNYYKLKSINSLLKEIKQEVILGDKKESAIPEIRSSSSGLDGESSSNYELAMGVMGEQSCNMNYNSENFKMPLWAILRQYYDPLLLSPKGIPDLNMSIEEINRKYYIRFLAAQARQNRIQIRSAKTKTTTTTTTIEPPSAK